MKIITIKSILIFFVTVLLAFSFPLQVISSSPIPSLAPYFGMILIFMLSLGVISNATQMKKKSISLIVFLIMIYIFLVIFHTAWQSIFGLISIKSSISALVIFLLPTLFFVYFRAIATNQEIRAFLFAASILGLILGAYFVYDSFSMLILGNMNDYSAKAFEYSQLRSPGDYINSARIQVGYRSHGLLENHTVSAAWIALGCFSALSLIPQKQLLLRLIVITIFGTGLLIGLNFTSIVAFTMVILLVEFREYVFLTRGAIPKKVISLLQIVVIFFVLLGLIQFLMPNLAVNDMYNTIILSLEGQVNLAIGATLAGQRTYFDGLVVGFYSYFHNLLDYPLGLIIGDGFSPFGSKKGGDYGIIDTLHRFGLLFFITIFVGLLTLIYRALKQIEFSNPDLLEKNTYLFFASSFTMYLLFIEVHYSAWSSKSILPILFICLALFDRYVHSSIRIKM